MFRLFMRSTIIAQPQRIADSLAWVSPSAQRPEAPSPAVLEKTEKWKEGYFILELNLLEEEAFPLTPYDDVRLPFTYENKLSAAELNHRRSTSSLSSMDRQKPHGPRRRDS